VAEGAKAAEGTPAEPKEGSEISPGHDDEIKADQEDSEKSSRATEENTRAPGAEETTPAEKSAFGAFSPFSEAEAKRGQSGLAEIQGTRPSAEQIANSRFSAIQQIGTNEHTLNHIAAVIGTEANRSNPAHALPSAIGILESLLNRIGPNGDVERGLATGFYGPINRAAESSGVGRDRGAEALWQSLSPERQTWATQLAIEALAHVAAGSDTIRGRDDQGMRHEIHGPGAIERGGE